MTRRRRVQPGDFERSEAAKIETGSDEIVPGAEYRVLSVQPPWAWSIIFAGKDIENRSWSTPYRGRILIHASSKKFAGDALFEARRYIAASARMRERDIPNDFPRSQMLGTVEIVDCVYVTKSPWAHKGNCFWVLRNPRPLFRPIEGVDGKLNLWRWKAPA